jgi:hypothetical protein
MVPAEVPFLYHYTVLHIFTYNYQRSAQFIMCGGTYAVHQIYILIISQGPLFYVLFSSFPTGSTIWEP